MDLSNMNLGALEEADKTPATPPAPTGDDTNKDGDAGQVPATPDGGEAQPEPQLNLVKLPDGRLVTGEAAVEEYKLLQAAHTKATQQLAELNRSKEPEAVKPWQQEGYEPQSWDEVFNQAKEAAIAEIEARQSQKATQEQQAQATLDIEINAIKAIDPNLNENAVLEFANKRANDLGLKYPNFTVAYQDYKMFNKAETLAEKRAIENRKQREQDPINAGASGGASNAVGVYPAGASLHEKAQIDLARMK